MAQISKPQAGKSPSDNVTQLGKQAIDQAADAARRATDEVEDLARSNSADLQRASGSLLGTQRAVAGQAAQGANEVGQMLAQLFSEQAKHNVEVFAKLTRTFSWAESARIQADFLHASLDRTAQFTRRYLEATRTIMTPAARSQSGEVRPLHR